MAAPLRTAMIALDRTLRLDYDQPLNVNSLPSLSEYTASSSVTGALTIQSIVIFGNSVYIGVSARMQGLITVNYTGLHVKNLAGELAAAITNQNAVNNSGGSDVTTPYPIGGTIAGAAILIYFSEVLDPANVPGASAFGVVVDAVPAVLTGITIYGTLLSMVATPSGSAGENATFSYTPPGVTPLQDYAGLKVSPIVAMLLTNLSNAAGYYASQSDIEDWFGVDNVASWSQLDNDVAVADETRIARALVYADRQIDRELRTAGYSTPIATGSADFDLLSDIAAEMAGVWLYLARGKQDLGGGETGAAMAGKMDDHRKHADDELTDLIADGIDGTARFTDTSGAPIQIVAGNSALNGVAADGLPLGWFN